LVFSEAFLVKQYVFVNVKPLCLQFGAHVTNQHTHDDPVTGYNISPTDALALEMGSVSFHQRPEVKQTIVGGRRNQNHRIYIQFLCHVGNISYLELM